MMRVRNFVPLLAAAFAVVIPGAATEAAPAAAAPTIDRVRAAVVGSKLRVTVDATMGRRGTVRVAGTANGRRIRTQKSLAAGGDSVPLVLDPRRARLRNVNGPVDFKLVASVQAKGVRRVTAQITARIGVPTIVLPGLGNEQSPGGFDLFGQALDNASGGAYGFGGRAPLLVIHEYDSLTQTLPALAKGLDRAAKKLMKGSIFKRVDVVGYSMGGLVARKWMAGAGKGRVRKLVFLGTPNQGAPIAYIARLAATSGVLDTLIANAGGGALTEALDVFANDQSLDALVNFTPTYDWALFSPLPGVVDPFPVDLSLLETLLANSGAGGGAVSGTPPLDALNRVAPDRRADLHAFYYSSVPTETFGIPVGTIDVVDLTPIIPALLTGGTPDFTGVDLAELASGSGDGIVPAHSVTMDEVPAWSRRITKHDLGAGTHVTFTLDPQVYTAVAAVLGK